MKDQINMLKKIKHEKLKRITNDFFYDLGLYKNLRLKCKKVY